MVQELLGNDLERLKTSCRKLCVRVICIEKVQFEPRFGKDKQIVINYLEKHPIMEQLE